MIQHPEIFWIERTGYPSSYQETEREEFDEDAAYDEARDRDLFGQED